MPFEAPNNYMGITNISTQWANASLTHRRNFNMGALAQIIANATLSVQNKIQTIQQNGSSISIGDMFDMQMLMNHLEQLSEMSTSVVSTANTVIMDMARNIKG